MVESPTNGMTVIISKEMCCCNYDIGLVGKIVYVKDGNTRVKTETGTRWHCYECITEIHIDEPPKRKPRKLGEV